MFFLQRLNWSYSFFCWVLSSAKILSMAALTLVKASSFTGTARAKSPTLWFFFAAFMRVVMTLLVLRSCASTVMSVWRKLVPTLLAKTIPTDVSGENLDGLAERTNHFLADLGAGLVLLVPH